MKLISDITKQDSRNAFTSGSIDEIHQHLDVCELSRNVPINVAALFDTAKNLSLYAWFVYEFHPVAELIGFQALELAVRQRADQEGTRADNKPFKILMTKALEKGWIIEKNMPNRRQIAKSRIEQRRILEIMQKTGNLADEPVHIESPSETEIDIEASQMEIARSVCDAAIRLRNGLAHGSHYQTPNSASRLRITAAIINQLFPAP